MRNSQTELTTSMGGLRLSHADAPPSQPPAPTSWRNRAREQVLALAAARLPRLGSDNPAAKLPADCCERIFQELCRRTPLVIDNGSADIKAGIAGDDVPRAVFPNIVGTPKVPGIMLPGMKERYVGDAAKSHRGILTLRYPVEFGIVTNWDLMIDVWRHTFLCELQAVPSDQPVLLTEAPTSPKGSRERLAQVMFDVFGVPAMYVCSAAALALFSTGRTSGVVVDSGASTTHIVPIFQGYAMAHGIQRLDIAGRDLTGWMMRLLASRGYSFTTVHEREIVEHMKEKMCFVALDYEQTMLENEASLERTYDMPEGLLFTIGRERFRCPEALFDPSLLGMSAPGIVDTIFDAIMKCDADILRDLYANVVLSGGNTLFSGFDARVAKELKERAPSSMESVIKVVASAVGRYSAWAGGSLLASLPTFQQSWITRAAYVKEGPAVVHRMCMP